LTSIIERKILERKEELKKERREARKKRVEGTLKRK